MQYNTITYEVHNGIGTITLNRPKKLNAFNREMTLELESALKSVSLDRSAKVLIITGAGNKAFSAGTDLNFLGGKGITSLENRASAMETIRIVDLISGLELPVIAKIHGYALGIGLSYALAADFIFASESSKLGIVHTARGIVPDGGACYQLVRLVGPLKAKELIFTGQIIGGKEAQKIGLITRCLSDENLSKEVDTVAQKLAEGPTAAYGMAKKIINLGIDLHRTVVMEMEAFANGVAADTEDMKEGVNAFLEKRSAKFKGH